VRAIERMEYFEGGQFQFKKNTGDKTPSKLSFMILEI